MSHADDVFFRQFGGILGFLAVFAVGVWLIAGAVGDASHAKIMASPTSTLTRIAPVGSVALAEADAATAVLAAGAAAPVTPVPAAVPTMPVATAAAAAVPPATGTASSMPAAGATAAAQPPAAAAVAAAAVDSGAGEALYTSACSACHIAGVANAPKLDDPAAWAPRAALGMDALLNSVINGKGVMPPRAGRPDAKDAELRAAIQYMLNKAGVSAG